MRPCGEDDIGKWCARLGATLCGNTEEKRRKRRGSEFWDSILKSCTITPNVISRPAWRKDKGPKNLGALVSSQVHQAFDYFGPFAMANCIG